MLDKLNNILILAPHTDDGEIGCGGLIHKLTNMGKTCHYVAFSIAEESVPKEFPNDILATEVKNATKVLEIKEENLHINRYPVRKLDQYRQDILEYMVKLNKTIKPDLILTPMTNDIHQDHSVITSEAIRAFKKSSILGYELVWNNLTCDNKCFFVLDKNNIDKKIEAIREYKSQQFRNYIDGSFIEALAKVRGTQINKEYAESFEVIRIII